MTGSDFIAEELPRRPGDPAAVVAKADKVRQVLGWVPKHDQLPGIVEDAIRWERYLATRNH